MKEYWEILRELREDRDLKQSAVAHVLGTTQQVYSRYENGVNEMPIRHLKTLCQYYDVSADYVLSLKQREGKSKGR
ncbi:MAG: helix-turn-helix transcriptional regulator [Clostridia bacterium]|nr:helix-turn-helix transcriptional regulator [Clostridia bacterium]